MLFSHSLNDPSISLCHSCNFFGLLWCEIIDLCKTAPICWLSTEGWRRGNKEERAEREEGGMKQDNKEKRERENGGKGEKTD